MRVEGQADLSSYDGPGTRPWDVQRTTDEPRRFMGRRGEEKECQPSHQNSDPNPINSARQQGEKLVWDSASRNDSRLEATDRGAQRDETVQDIEEEFRGRLERAKSKELERQLLAAERDRKAREVAQAIDESQGRDQEDHLDQLEAALFQKMEDLGNNLHHLRSLKHA